MKNFHRFGLAFAMVLAISSVKPACAQHFDPAGSVPTSLSPQPTFNPMVSTSYHRLPGAGYAIDSDVDGFLPDGWAQCDFDAALAASLIDGLYTDSALDSSVEGFTTTAGNIDRELMADLLQPRFGVTGIDLVIEVDKDWPMMIADDLSSETGTTFAFVGS